MFWSAIAAATTATNIMIDMNWSSPAAPITNVPLIPVSLFQTKTPPISQFLVEEESSTELPIVKLFSPIITMMTMDEEVQHDVPSACAQDDI